MTVQPIEHSVYVETFFKELSPVWLNYVAALHGVPTCNLDLPFTYMELGCGFGGSAIANAGAFPRAEFHACDFNPEHIAAAQQHARALDIGNIQFHQAAFADLLTRDLPNFDFIALHGVYSWVDRDARDSLRQFIRRKLNPGGLVYVSYNCLPGWSVEIPLRKLFVELAATFPGELSARAAHAAQAMQELSNSNLGYFNTHPTARTAVEAYIRSPAEYLAHEFLSQNCEPFHSIDVAQEMTDIELQWVGSATLPDNHAVLVMDDAAANAIEKLATPRQRQLTSDFAANRSFRRDVFIRTPAEVDRQGRQLNDVVLGCLNLEGISSKVKVPRGVIHFKEEFVRELRQLMASGSMTMGDIVTTLSGNGANSTQVARNLLFLMAAGVLTPFARTYQCGSVLKSPRLLAMTERVLAHAIEHRAKRVIPSEVLGNGIEIHPAEALAIRELLSGHGAIIPLAQRLEAQLPQFELTGANEDSKKFAHRIALHAIETVLPSLSRAGLIAVR